MNFYEGLDKIFDKKCYRDHPEYIKLKEKIIRLYETHDKYDKDIAKILCVKDITFDSK